MPEEVVNEPVVEPKIDPAPPATDPAPAPAKDSGGDPAPKEAEVIDLKLPENSLLGKDRVDEIAAFAKAQGLSSKAAQALLEREHTAASTAKTAGETAFKTEAATWLKALENDKEIGGANFKRNAELAKRVLQKHGSKEFGEQLASTGFGNYPELVRFVVRVGKAFGEDQFFAATTAVPEKKKSAAERLYPNHNKKKEES